MARCGRPFLIFLLAAMTVPHLCHMDCQYELVKIDFMNAANLIMMTHGSNHHRPRALTAESAEKNLQLLSEMNTISISTTIGWGFQSLISYLLKHYWKEEWKNAPLREC